MLVISFADGLTSATAPDVGAGLEQSFTLANNQSTFANITGMLADEASVTTQFIDFEIVRSETGNTYTQHGKLTHYWDGAQWVLTSEITHGYEMLQDSVATDYFVQLQTNAGQVQYKTGNMGASYSGKIKFTITELSA